MEMAKRRTTLISTRIFIGQVEFYVLRRRLTSCISECSPIIHPMLLKKGDLDCAAVLVNAYRKVALLFMWLDQRQSRVRVPGRRSHR